MRRLRNLKQRTGELFYNIIKVIEALIVPDNWNTLKHCDVLLVCHATARYIKLAGYDYSPLLDSLGDDLTNRGLVCERLARAYSIRKGSYGAPVSINRQWFRETVWQRFYDKFLKVVWNWKSPKLNNEKASKVFLKVLKKTKCRYIISIYLPQSMYRAARQMDVPVIELLHGIGYAPIPWGWDKANPESLPKIVLSLDPTSTKTFSQLTDKGLQIKEILHPWHKRFLIPTERQKLPEEWKKSIRIPDYFRKKITISLEWGYDNEKDSYKGILKNGIIHEVLLNLIRNTQDSIFWFIRLHPVQLRERKYRRHRKFIETFVQQVKNSETVLSSSLPFSSLLVNCDRHITMSSMSSYDAAIFGVPTLLLCPTLQDGNCHDLMFRDLLETEIAELGLLDEQSIQQWVEKVHRCQPLFHADDDNGWNEIVELIMGDAGLSMN